MLKIRREPRGWRTPTAYRLQQDATKVKYVINRLKVFRPRDKDRRGRSSSLRLRGAGHPTLKESTGERNIGWSNHGDLDFPPASELKKAEPVQTRNHDEVL